MLNPVGSSRVNRGATEIEFEDVSLRLICVYTAVLALAAGCLCQRQRQHFLVLSHLMAMSLLLLDSTCFREITSRGTSTVHY